MATSDEWGTAYARQAQADFAAWSTLQAADLPECQKLHFLQMACEKLTKAHLCKSGTDPGHVQTSHAYIKKNLPTVLRDQLDVENYKTKVVRDIMRYVKRLAGEIEVLAPAVNEGGKRPDNCEYPWEDGNKNLRVPMDHTFFTDELLMGRHGRTILKLIGASIDRLVGESG